MTTNAGEPLKLFYCYAHEDKAAFKRAKELGVSCVSNSKQHANEILGSVQRYIEETRPDVIILHVETELISW
ncbi:MAG: hypothetical protein NVS9B9_08430 [Ktedonobacteraceae bacterium]